MKYSALIHDENQNAWDDFRHHNYINKFSQTCEGSKRSPSPSQFGSYAKNKIENNYGDQLNEKCRIAFFLGVLGCTFSVGVCCLGCYFIAMGTATTGFSMAWISLMIKKNVKVDNNHDASLIRKNTQGPNTNAFLKKNSQTLPSPSLNPNQVYTLKARSKPSDLLSKHTRKSSRVSLVR